MTMTCTNPRCQLPEHRLEHEPVWMHVLAVALMFFVLLAAVLIVGAA